MRATPRLVFSVLLLLAWVHLVVTVYPTPAQKEHEIAKLAEEGVAVDQSLRSKGVPEKLLPQTTKEQYVAALTAEYWRDWALATTFLLFGVVAAGLTYRGVKFWPLVVGLTSAAYAAMITYPILTHGLGWVGPVAQGVLSGKFVLAYQLMVQPLLHLAIVITCVIVWRQRKSGLSHATVA